LAPVLTVVALVPVTDPLPIRVPWLTAVAPP